MTADLRVPSGVSRRRREPVGRTEQFAVRHAPGPYVLPVGHLVAIEITDEAAHQQFGMGYWSDGLMVWGSGWGSRVTEVLAEDPRGWWVHLNDYRAVLVRPEDILGVHDTGPASTREEVAAMWREIRRSPDARPVRSVPVRQELL